MAAMPARRVGQVVACCQHSDADGLHWWESPGLRAIDAGQTEARPISWLAACQGCYDRAGGDPHKIQFPARHVLVEDDLRGEN